MKIIILSPNADKIFTKNQLSDIGKTGELVIVNKIKPFASIKQLSSSDDKILAIDPDFCSWKVAKKDIDIIPNIKAICLQTSSFSWIDSNYCATKNIPVLNLYKGFSANAVSEWAIMNAMMLSRQFPKIIRSGWKEDHNQFLGFELIGKTAGIVGLGNNGKAIAEKCARLGMKVVYWSKKSRSRQYQYISLNKLFKTADYIFPCLAKNDKTVKLITDKTLRKMKRTANIISTCFLDLYNHQLVLKLTEKGNINGYAFEEEGGKTFNKYKGNILATPALAWYTKESLERNADQWTENIIKAAKGDYRKRIN